MAFKADKRDWFSPAHLPQQLCLNGRCNSVFTGDPRFAQLLLEQFGSATGELSAASQYWVRSFHVENAGIRDRLQDISSNGSTDERGSWNSEPDFRYIADPVKQMQPQADQQ